MASEFKEETPLPKEELQDTRYVPLVVFSFKWSGLGNKT